jgi:hypothetical protein
LGPYSEERHPFPGSGGVSFPKCHRPRPRDRPRDATTILIVDSLESAPYVLLIS